MDCCQITLKKILFIYYYCICKLLIGNIFNLFSLQYLLLATTEGWSKSNHVTELLRFIIGVMSDIISISKHFQTFASQIITNIIMETLHSVTSRRLPCTHNWSNHCKMCNHWKNICNQSGNQFHSILDLNKTFHVLLHHFLIVLPKPHNWDLHWDLLLILNNSEIHLLELISPSVKKQTPRISWLLRSSNNLSQSIWQKLRKKIRVLIKCLKCDIYLCFNSI